MNLLMIILILSFFNKECESDGYCQNQIKFYERQCAKIKLTYPSLLTCFKENVNFTMGTNTPIFKSDGEGPSRLVLLRPFCIDQTEVSNLQFSEFVKATGYVTEAEKYGNSFCFYQNLSENIKKTVKNKV
jgi:hypothetical protein